MNIPESAGPALIGFSVTLATSILIASTKRWHGRFSLDTHSGPQKFHDTPTPRIGGIAVYAGLLAAAAAAEPSVRELLLVVAIGVVPAFAAGLAEDFTKNISASFRLLATMISALIYCLLAGYAVTRLDIAFLDGFMGLPFVSVAFTVFVMAGLANGINIIDGCHGLATGTIIIMLCALGVLAFLAEDHGLMLVAITVAAVLAGFLPVNFPFGFIFLGDGGAYLAGLTLGALAVMLAARNPEVPAWTVAVVLAYPVLETLFSIARKSLRPGHSPSRPDEMHLHMLVYRRFASMLGETSGEGRLANPITGAVMWGGALSGLAFVVSFPQPGEWPLVVFLLQVVVYGLIYRQLALPDRSPASATAGPRRPSQSETGKNRRRRQSKR